MKVSKLEGLQMLSFFNFPTVQPIEVNYLDNNSTILQQGLSVRTAPKENRENNVYLPSIHNCKDLTQIRSFIQENRRQYDIITHPTVKPEIIGSASRIDYGKYSAVAIELFDDFRKRKEEIVRNRAVIPIEGERMQINKMELDKNDKKDFTIMRDVISYLRKMPFEVYDIEFVIQEGNLIFTDLTVQDNNEYKIIKGLMKAKDKEENEGGR